MNLPQQPNLNYLWAYLAIEELVRNSADYFCLAPGSRSSPLAINIAENPKAKSFVHFDERGLGFHALGYAMSTQKPVVIVTTSGTAVANLFPAIIEASKKKLPLIILTADRPPELRHTGAHQTIDQVKIFGDYVKFFFDLPCPTTDIKTSFVLTTIDQAIARAKGNPPGPVHLNFMFREPLAPIKTTYSLDNTKDLSRWAQSKKPFTQNLSAQSSLEIGNDIASTIANAKSGLIVAGKLKNTEETQLALKLAQKLGWPIFPDTVSGLRLKTQSKNVIHYFDQLLLSEKLADKISFDCVLHLGGRLTSKRYYALIDKIQPQNYLMVLAHPLRHDPLHNVSCRIQGSVGDFIKNILPKIKVSPPHPWLKKLETLNQAIDELIENDLFQSKPLSEVFVARAITKLIPQNHGLFLANSLPIREIDMYGARRDFDMTIGANRGASGIDGTIASASGYGTGLERDTTLLVGDLAFLHDLNSLSMLENAKAKLICVVLNNQGGGIFNFLPIAETEKHFEKFFAARHNWTFQKAAELFKLKYYQPQSNAEFTAHYKKALSDKHSAMIEIITAREETTKMVQLLQKIIQNFIDKNNY